MSLNGPSINIQSLWARKIDECIKTLEQGLILLRQEKNLPQSENDLNLKLYYCLLRANRKLNLENNLIYEGNNQPDPDDHARTARLNKRPDFQWVYIDSYEKDPIYSSKQVIAECKRIGFPTSPQWILNQKYVENGITRFIDPDWGYAKRFDCGFMVGYWQNMNAVDILNEINTIAVVSNIPPIILSPNGWQINSVSRLEHKLNRTFPISPFSLLHQWVDLRVKPRKAKRPIREKNKSK